MVPTHFWLLEALTGSSWTSLVWGLTFHKVPLYLLWVTARPDGDAWLVLSFLLGGLLLSRLGSMESVMIVSSRNTLALLFLLPGRDLVLIVYFIALWAAVSSGGLTRGFLFLVLAGLPPLFLFQLKLRVWSYLLESGSLVPALCVAGGAAVAGVAYLRLFVLLDKGGVQLFGGRVVARAVLGV